MPDVARGLRMVRRRFKVSPEGVEVLDSILSEAV